VTARRARACAALVAALALPSATVAVAQSNADSLQAFRATYGLLDGGKQVGSAEFTLRYDAATARYIYESRSEFDGLLLRFAAPRPVIERSEFRVERGEIKTLAYLYRDGTRRGRRNLTLDFDWPHQQLVVAHTDDSTTLALPPHAIDRASVKLALALAARDGRRTGSHVIADPDEFRTYEFASEGMDRIRTPAGEFDAYRIKQWRAESSRQTFVWLAPALGFHAARIEQHRPDRDPVAFVLESFERLAADGSPVPATPR